MKVEDLIEKDKQKQVNPFAFTRLQGRLNEKTNQSKNFVLLHSLQIISLLLVLAFSVNLFTQSRTQEISSQESSFEQFAQENYFDILTNYYPEILFE
jgi:hypothetical protein